MMDCQVELLHQIAMLCRFLGQPGAILAAMVIVLLQTTLAALSYFHSGNFAMCQCSDALLVH